MISEIWPNVALGVIVILFSLVMARFDFPGIGKLWRRFRSKPHLTQVVILIGLSSAILYGGSKVRNQGGRRMVPEMIAGEEDDLVCGLNTNRFAITDFALDPSNRLVGFSLKWDEDLFSSLDSYYVDLFMSTNLSTRNWFWLNDFHLPPTTNVHTLIVDEYDVTYDMRNVFTNAFNT